MSEVGILGAGTWGLALARLLFNSGHSIQIWSPIEKEIKILSSERRHPNLINLIIPPEVEFTNQIEAVCKGKRILIVAVPSVYVRSTIRSAGKYVKEGTIIVTVSKGIEAETLKTMSEIIKEELKARVPVVVLSGPSHAEEVARDLPTTIVAACEDLEKAKMIQEFFSSSVMRVYTNPDVKGVELSGALKNIIALATGISTGLGYGDNANAAIITRGILEIKQLGIQLGCKEETFWGLAGVGDLIVTAISKHSRNNRCGILIGQGYSVEKAIQNIGMVVEGINALPAAMQLSQAYCVELPIINAVYDIVYKNEEPLRIAEQLMDRPKKSETNKLFNNSSEIIEYYQNSFNLDKGEKKMKRVITYGTFDLLHYGHINLLKRAKMLGDYLIVAISTDEFNWNEKRKKCYFTYEQRKALVEALRYVDLVIPEESWEQKRTDIHEYHVDTFVIGDDWKGKFDFLKDEGAEVIYLSRTPEISSSQIKKDLNEADTVSESQIKHDDINTEA